MATWSELEHEAPDIAAAGRRLLYQGGLDAPPYGFLGTVRKDGGPRLHPICPVILEGRLWAFIVNLGYKYRDLLRDPRYALHSFPAPEGGEEFYLMGAAAPETDPATRARIAAGAGRLGSHDFEVLFSLDIDHALYTRWEGWGTEQTWPSFAKWKAKG